MEKCVARVLLILAAFLLVAPAGVTRADSAEASAAEKETEGTAELHAAEQTPAPGVESRRIGFWEVDLAAVDYEPRGTTYRIFDLKILRLLEFGQGSEGSDYQSLGFLEMPGLLSLFANRRDDSSSELRVLDLQALDFAIFRQTRDEGEGGTHFLKLPIIGSLWSVETDEEDPEIEHHTYGYLFRRKVHFPAAE
jgi:hypothetical protein